MRLRLLVTGSRFGWPVKAFDSAMNSAVAELMDQGASEFVIVHGGAPGVDAQAAQWAWERDFPTEAHPADWANEGKAAGPRRNQRMVDAGASLCLAFPGQTSRGTQDCMKRAEAAGIRVITITQGATP